MLKLKKKKTLLKSYIFSSPNEVIFELKTKWNTDCDRYFSLADLVHIFALLGLSFVHLQVHGLFPGARRSALLNFTKKERHYRYFSTLRLPVVTVLSYPKSYRLEIFIWNTVRTNLNQVLSDTPASLIHRRICLTSNDDLLDHFLLTKIKLKCNICIFKKCIFEQKKKKKKN